MSIETSLIARSGGICELCGSSNNLSPCEVPPSDNSSDQYVLVCETCQSQMTDKSTMDENHWRCLNDSMWSPVPAVQVLSYRLLHDLRGLGWPQELFDMMYMEDDVKAWADKGLSEEDDEVTEITKDNNGAQLNEGDDVTLIKDLVVKGANFTAKRGTLVRNIHLTDNPLHIEGKVNGTQIVLVADFLKKA